MSLSSTPGTSGVSSQQDYLALLGSLSPLPFDPNTVVTAELASDTQRVTDMQNSIKNIQNDQSSYKSIATDVAALQAAAFALTLQSSVQASAATSSSPTAVTATASPSAVAGSYSVAVTHLATATTATSMGGIGQALDGRTSQPLSALNFGTPPTAGQASVVVDGQIETFTVDPTQSMDTLLSQIQSAIASGTGLAPSAVGVTVAGNRVAINIGAGNGAHTISFGAGGDSSNIFAALGLQTAGGTTDGTTALALSSDRPLGVSQPTQTLAQSALGTSLTTLNGSFSINGTTINFTSSDTLSDIIARINSSSAGVTATYDAVRDRVTLTSTATGQQAIALADTPGSNMLAALGLAPGATTAQSLGSNAAFTVNGTTVTSPSNTLSGAIPGVTITALALTGGTPATLTVGPDTSGITTKVQAFVDAANKVLGDVNLTQQKDPTSGAYSDLFGDPTLVGLKNSLLQMVTSPVTTTGPYQSLQDLGLTTGAVGSAPGTTTTFTLDTTKLAAAISANPGLVANLFAGTTATAGFTGVAQQLSTYLNQQTNPVNGPFAVFQTTSAEQVQLLQGQITAQNNLIAQKRQTLLSQFTAMAQSLTQLASESTFFTAMSNSSSGSSSSGH